MALPSFKKIGILTASQAILYLAFASHIGVREAAASIVAGGAGTSALLIFVRTGRANIRVRAWDMTQAWRIPALALTGTITTIGALLGQLILRRPMRSSIRATEFNLGSRRSTYDAGRRALAASYPTATPNFIVLGFIDRGSLIVYHRLVPGPLPTMLHKLGGA